MGPFWAISVLFQSCFRAVSDCFGPFWGHFRVILGTLRAVLRPVQARFGSLKDPLPAILSYFG
jgi:hypothetical protein